MILVWFSNLENIDQNIVSPYKGLWLVLHFYILLLSGKLLLNEYFAVDLINF